MEQGTFEFAGEDTPAPVKLCDCGCGQPAPIAKVTRTERGQVKGQPIRFIWGHGRRKPREDGDRQRRSSRPYIKQADTDRCAGHPPVTLFAEMGQRFGRGVVIDPQIRIVQPGSPVRTRRGALLRCDCGTEYPAEIKSLFSGNTRSCGCLQADSLRLPREGHGRPVTDRAGQRFGMLTAIRFTGTAGGWAQWLCRCDCGREVTLTSSRLLAALSCGCLKSAPKGRRVPGEAARRHVLNQYRKNARSRGRAWDLTDADFDRLTSSACHYCGAPPGKVFSTGKYEGAAFTYNGIDRVDSTLGYTVENSVPCCSICNIAKKDLPYDDFLAWIARLTEYHFFHPDVMPSALLRKAAG